ncbi:unnamed protein product [Calypogeia fissa]
MQPNKQSLSGGRRLRSVAAYLPVPLHDDDGAAQHGGPPGDIPQEQEEQEEGQDEKEGKKKAEKMSLYDQLDGACVCFCTSTISNSILIRRAQQPEKGPLQAFFKASVSFFAKILTNVGAILP